MGISTVHQVTVRQYGDRVMVVENGKAIIDLPWQAADELANAIRAQARRAEEEDKVEQIIDDQAILFRTGFPLALTSRKDMLKEAAKEAAWNSSLRRKFPHSLGIASGVKFGTPIVRKVKP